MPENRYGQLLTFAVEEDDDTRFSRWIKITVKKGQTIKQIAAERGHPEDARAIAEKNGIRSVKSKLSRKELKVPGNHRESLSFDVLPGEGAPTITGGYAKLGILDRPERVGVTTFEGYDPITMVIPIRFESWMNRDGGTQLERDIQLLEGMAGRGIGRDAVGPPPTVRITARDAKGDVSYLLPENYQVTDRNKNAPIWRIADIDWDEEPLRGGGGRRLRQLATVTVQQATRVNLAVALAQRAKKPAKKGAAGGTYVGRGLK